MTDEEAQRIINEPPENNGFNNEIKQSELGKYEFKCSRKFEKEELTIKVESKLYDVDDIKMDHLFEPDLI